MCEAYHNADKGNADGHLVRPIPCFVVPFVTNECKNKECH